MYSSCRRFLIATSLVLAAWLGVSTAALAVPAFARQTGMNCNSCHIGTDNVPNFTHTGRLFAMKGYTRPYVRERLRSEGTMSEDNQQYGGEYLALNWTDFWSMRFISEVVEGGHNINGTSRDTTTRPLSRAAMFFTGAITDWLGIWTELGYLGNNTLSSVTTGQQGPTAVNFFAYDEYRLAASWDLDPKGFFGPNSFFGMSLGNEHPNSVGQFNFPIALPDMWYNGQGGVGRSKDIGTFSVHGMFRGKWWLQLAGVSGGDNVNLSDGSNQYLNVAYNAIGRTKNDLWVIGEIYRGNDFPSIMTPQKNSFICPGVCPPGIVDSSLSFSTVPGFTSGAITGAPVEIVKDFFSYKVSVQQAVADSGPHTWYAAATFHDMQQDFVSGGEVQRTMLGGTLRYFYKRTYGVELYLRDDLKYEYTTALDVKRDTHSKAMYGATLLWYPAMNFSVHLAYNPIAQNIVFRDQQDLYLGDGDSYRFGFEYNL